MFLKDISFRMVPFDEDEAEKMINQVKGSRFLRGYRNSVPVDLAALKKIYAKYPGLQRNMKKLMKWT